MIDAYLIVWKSISPSSSSWAELLAKAYFLTICETKRQSELVREIIEELLLNTYKWPTQAELAASDGK